MAPKTNASTQSRFLLFCDELFIEEGQGRREQQKLTNAVRLLY